MLAALYVVAGLLGYLVLLFPLSDTVPVTETIVVSSIGMLAGLALLVSRRPVTDRLIIVYSTGGILMLSFLMSHSTTQLGTAVTAMPYIWFSVYLGAYLEPRAARIQVALLCSFFGIALVVSEVPVPVGFWVISSATIIVTTEALLATNRALRLQARVDPLTGLLNRRGLEEAAMPVVAIGTRIGKPTALAIVDLDDFKAVNDSEGHSAGDRILVDLSAAWMGEQRSADLLSRLGGDEFVIVMPATDLEQAGRLIDRYRSAHPVAWSHGTVEIAEGESLAAAIDRADRVLYGAKGDSAGA